METLELLENARVAAILTGQAVPEALIVRAASLPARTQEARAALETATARARQAGQTAAQNAAQASYLDAAASRALTAVQAQPASGGTENAARAVAAAYGAAQTGASGGGIGAGVAQTAAARTDMAAISRFFERDARRYGQEGD